jgi:vacuolar-type H+-ATPase subunit I/STV1
MTRLKFVKKAQKNYDQYGIKKGDSYYWWKFRYSSRIMSKTRPKRSQLTQSSFLGQIYDIEDAIGITELSEIPDAISEFVSTLQELQSEVEESLENMPEHLRDTSSSGELLTERIEELETMISEIEHFESVDLDDEETVLDDFQAICYNGG